MPASAVVRQILEQAFFGPDPISGVLADHVLTVDSPVFERDPKEQKTLADPVDTQKTVEKLAQKARALFLKHQSYLPEDATMWRHRYKGQEYTSITHSGEVLAVFRIQPRGTLLRLVRPPKPIAAAAALIA
ncbi:MAG: hypothetical protein GY789_18390 [Hyphomicrobiales bacterium]|nr:hypothetical protein [Hyphomicrobiales bacterium]